MNVCGARHCGHRFAERARRNFARQCCVYPQSFGSRNRAGAASLAFTCRFAAASHGLWTRKEDPSLRFIQDDNRDLTSARLALLRATEIVLANGLDVIGVEPNTEMRQIDSRLPRWCNVAKSARGPYDNDFLNEISSGNRSSISECGDLPVRPRRAYRLRHCWLFILRCLPYLRVVYISMLIRGYRKASVVCRQSYCRKRPLKVLPKNCPQAKLKSRAL